MFRFQGIGRPPRASHNQPQRVAIYTARSTTDAHSSWGPSIIARRDMPAHQASQSKCPGQRRTGLPLLAHRLPHRIGQFFTPKRHAYCILSILNNIQAWTPRTLSSTDLVVSSFLLTRGADSRGSRQNNSYRRAFPCCATLPHQPRELAALPLSGSTRHLSLGP